MKSRRVSLAFGASLAGCVATLMLAGSALAATSSETVIHSFGTSNSNPSASLVADSSGNMYGTTFVGNSMPYGSVFEESPASTGGWKETILFNFNGNDGSGPSGPMILDSKGNLYGVTSNGGDESCGSGNPGCGVVFELIRPTEGGAWKEVVLHEFSGGSDGRYPEGNLVFDSAGNLFGTTANGGGTGCSGLGCGTVFRLKPPAMAGGTWTETVLHRFDGNDGSGPGGLVLKGEVLYGAAGGGAKGDGLIFELKQDDGHWTETVLYAFNGSDGSGPGGLTFGASGNLYGATGGGGQYNWGTVFELTRSSGGTWSESVLYDFTGGADGGNPFSPLVLDESGSLYGTTDTGGLTAECNWTEPEDGCGVVYKLASGGGAAWTETVLHTFSDTGTDGNLPGNSGVILGVGGALYGTTEFGGTGGCVAFRGNTTGCGTVYKVVP